MQPLFTVKEALSFGWKKTIENLWFLVILTVSTLILSVAFDNMKGDFAPVYRILNMLVSYFAMFVFVKAGLKIYSGSKPEAKDILDVHWPLFGWYLLGTLLANVVVGLGFVLLIIPGIYLAIRLNLVSLTLVDQGLKPVEALKKSMALTKGQFWYLLWFTVVLVVINVLGAIAFVLGLLISIPVSILAMVYVYEKLKAAPVVVASTPAATPIETTQTAA